VPSTGFGRLVGLFHKAFDHLYSLLQLRVSRHADIGKALAELTGWEVKNA
jgi:hypothetical protein